MKHQTADWYIRDETYAPALRRLVDQQQREPQASFTVTMKAAERATQVRGWWCACAAPATHGSRSGAIFAKLNMTRWCAAFYQ